ncbi:MAG: carboxypeptidase-like regulatory domain-containing protein, partial [Thermofilaceae archaeon]
QISLNVADSITIRLLKSDGSLMNDCRLILLFDPNNYNVTVYNGRVQGGIIPLYNLPYGTYLADVTWYGVNILKTIFTIGGKYSTINLTSSLLAQVRLQILDTDSKPLQFIKVKITGMGIEREVTTNAAGYVFLTDIPPGTYYVTVKCIGGEASSLARITTSESWAVIPSRRLNLTIVSEYAGGLITPNLPPGLWASIYYNDSLLNHSENIEESPQLTLNLDEPVCVQASLKLKIGWNENILIEKTLVTYSSQLVEKVPFLNLEIKVTDKGGDPLAGALVEVSDELGVRTFKTNERGIVYVYHIYGKRFKVEVKWEGVSVALQNVHAPAYSLELNADVWKLRVDVKNAIGNPISGALIVFLVEGETFSYVVNSTTRDNGIVEFVLPVPSGSHVEMRMVKGRVNANYVVTNKDLQTGIIQVNTDLILDYGPLQLRVGEAIIIALMGVPMLLAVIVVYKRIVRRQTAESVFTVYGKEFKSEEEEGKSLVETLRDRFKTIFSAEEKEEESEEEENVFEEL